MSCRDILAGRDARVASDVAARTAWYAAHPHTLKSAPHISHAGVDPTTGQTSEENYCEAYEKSCRMDAGGVWNPDMDACESYQEWSINPEGTVKTVYPGLVNVPAVNVPAVNVPAIATDVMARVIPPSTDQIGNILNPVITWATNHAIIIVVALAALVVLPGLVMPERKRRKR